MSDEKIVILARPHPFIAQHMKKFLIDYGYTPFPIVERSDLDNLSNRGAVKGAIISTSVISTSGESYVEDFNFIRSEFGGLPIAFATLGKTADMLRPLTNAISSDDLAPTVLEVKDENKFNSAIGSNDGFLLLHKDNVANDDAKPLTATMIGKHFGA